MALLLLLPLGASLLLLLPGLTDMEAFAAAIHHPQFPGAVMLTLWTGLASTALATVLAVVIVSSQQQRLAKTRGLVSGRTTPRPRAGSGIPDRPHRLAGALDRESHHRLDVTSSVANRAGPTWPRPHAGARIERNPIPRLGHGASAGAG